MNMRCSLVAGWFFLGLALLVPTEIKSASWPGKIVLPAFPKPNPAQAFAGLKIFDTNGSPIRMPVDDWAGARQRVATNVAWQQWVTRGRAHVDEWIEKRRDRIGWIAGWHHDFVSPKDGSFLIFTPDEPGRATLRSHSDPKVELTPALHAAWVYEFRVKNASMMAEAARLFRLTGQARYAEWAAGQLDFYTDNYDQWKTHGDVHFMFQSLDEAVILIKWVNTANALGDYVTADMKTRWSEKLFKPEAALLKDSFQHIHNIACWHRSAVGQVAIYCQDDDLWQAAVEGKFGIRNLVACGITSDYVWYEQSLGYSGYVVRALVPFFESALMAGKGNDLRLEMETVENLLLSPLAMRFPNGQLPNPADGGKPRRLSAALVGDLSSQETVEDSDQLDTVWRIYPTRPGLNLLQTSQAKSWEVLLDPPSDWPITAQLPAVTSHNMESSRMAIIRSGSWQVFFHYGQLASSHSQAEALNFEVFFNDIDITHDPGTTGYGSKLTTEYFRSGVCHNVALVDGFGQESWNPGKLVNFNETNVAASQPAYRSNAQAARSLTINGDALCDTASITTTDGKEHSLGFVLNLQGKARLPEGFVKDADFSARHPAAAFKYWRDVRSMKARDEIGFDIDYDNLTIHVEFKLPGKFAISHASVPDYPPDYRESFFIETQGENATLETVLSQRAASK